MEFKKYKIEEIGTVVGGGTPSTKNDNYYGGNISWITPKDLSNYSNRYIYHGERNITEEGLNNSSAKLVPTDTILMTSRAPIGYLALAGKKVATNQGFKSIICNEEIVSPKYLYYLLQNKMDNIKSLGTGSTFSEISGKVVKNIEVSLPNLLNQKKVEKVLDSIDEKIELNQKIIANLEELSQTLFKRWFVDFEFPDENGNPYKSSGGEMVDSELGEIPEFWKISKLEEIIDYSNKSIDVEKSFDKLDYIGLEHIPKNNKISINNWEDSSKIKGKKTLVSKGDILFGKLRPYFQKVGISPINGVVSTDILVIRPKKEVFYYFLLIYISQNKFIQYTTNTATGTRMPRTGSKQINTYKLILPPVSTLELFNTTLKNITINILQKNQEIRTLEILRDTLLPKLMSGEIEIPDDIDVNEDELSI